MGKKTDDLDAERVAREAIGREDLATPRDTGDRDALAALLVARRSAVEMTGDAERQLVSLAATCPEPLAVRLRGKTTAQIVDTCTRWRPAGGTSITGVAEAMRSLARRIRSEAAFAMLAGVAPIPASSGKTNRHRLNRRGDRHLNCAIHIVALQRQRRDTATKAYFERRRSEGKTDREIRRCLKRYIARELYRVLESGLDKQ